MFVFSLGITEAYSGLRKVLRRKNGLLNATRARKKKYDLVGETFYRNLLTYS